MIVFNFIAALKRVLFGMVVLGLAFAPLQSITPASAATAMTMGKSDCPQKKNCCDRDNSACPASQSCMVQCSISFSPVSTVEDRSVILIPADMIILSAESPDSTAPPLLRRPPRI